MKENKTTKPNIERLLILFRLIIFAVLLLGSAEILYRNVFSGPETTMGNFTLLLFVLLITSVYLLIFLLCDFIITRRNFKKRYTYIIMIFIYLLYSSTVYFLYIS